MRFDDLVPKERQAAPERKQQRQIGGLGEKLPPALHIFPPCLAAYSMDHMRALSKERSNEPDIDEYVRKGDTTIHTSTIEGFFGIFKRGIKGVYQH